MLKKLFMSILKKINILRRKVTKLITSRIGKNIKANKPYNPNIKIKKILISRPNHRLGNQLLITPLIQEVEKLFPDSKVDLFVKGGASNEIFKNFTQIDEIITLPKKHFQKLGAYIYSWLRLKKKKYDLAINVINGSSSGRISIKFANSKYKLFGEEYKDKSIFANDFFHYAKQPVYNLRIELERIGIKTFQDEISPLNLKLNSFEIEKGKTELSEICNNNLKTISLFTYATGEKCYSKEWWNEFYIELKKHFPEINLIEILPVENISQLNFSIPTYYSKEIRDIAGVIANTSLFIGADSGMMHLATASGTPTLGLFSITNPKTYEPYGRMNKGINTNLTSKMEIIDMVKTILNSNL